MRFFIGCLAVSMTLSANAVFAMDMISEGVYRVNFERVDDLLELNATPGVRLLLLDGTKPKVVSDSHIKVLRNWVEAGGVLWVGGEGLDSVLAKNIAPYRVGRFGYKKASTDKRGGELVVKGVTPRLVIEDHALTEGVTPLYLFPRYRFDGTRTRSPRSNERHRGSTGRAGGGPARPGTAGAGRNGPQAADVLLRSDTRLERGPPQQRQARRDLEQLRLGEARLQRRVVCARHQRARSSCHSLTGWAKVRLAAGDPERVGRPGPAPRRSPSDVLDLKRPPFQGLGLFWG